MNKDKLLFWVTKCTVVVGNMVRERFLVACFAADYQDVNVRGSKLRLAR